MALIIYLRVLQLHCISRLILTGVGVIVSIPAFAQFVSQGSDELTLQFIEKQNAEIAKIPSTFTNPAALPLQVPPTPQVFQPQNAHQGKPEQASIKQKPISPFWKEKEEGWFWYIDPALEEEMAQPQQPVDPRPTELIEFEKFQKKLDEYRKIAIFNPTTENVRNYMRLHNQTLEMAGVFADTWQRITWQDPFFDYNLRGRPQNNRAAGIHDVERNKSVDRQVSELSKNHGLFFYFRGDCVYCHAFASTLKRFSKRTGMTIFPITLDGGTLAEFPDAVLDNGSAEVFGVTTVPALVLAEPGSGTGTIIGHGLLAEDEIMERIFILTSKPIGTRF